MRDRAVIAGSASKSYAMTGLRCGWTIGPPELIKACNTILSHATSNVSSITQKAALAALAGPQDDVIRMLNEYRVRRDNMHEWLTSHPGIKCVRPKGAFYLFPDISGLFSPSGVNSSAQFAEELLNKEHVALTPGEAFDAQGYVRISYATSPKNLRESADRILRFAESLKPS